MKKSNIKTAGLIIIGDEILSGRTQDTNTAYIAQRLEEIGIKLSEVRVIPDVIETIIATVQHFCDQFDYVFTTGGIGPTHDDKTAEAIAKAFDVPLEKNAKAYQMLADHYQDEGKINDARMKMAFIPKGANLIDNPVSGAPGFIIGKVHVMAGVPKIMQAMMGNILPHLEGGAVIHSRQLVVDRPESSMAHILASLDQEFESVDIGSYPRYREGSPEVTLILRSADTELLEKAFRSLNDKLESE